MTKPDGNKVLDFGFIGREYHSLAFGPSGVENFSIDFNFTVTQYGGGRRFFLLFYRFNTGTSTANGVGLDDWGSPIHFGSYEYSPGFIVNETIDFPGVRANTPFHFHAQYCNGELYASLREFSAPFPTVEHHFRPNFIPSPGQFGLYVANALIEFDDIVAQWEGPGAPLHTPSPTPSQTPTATPTPPPTSTPKDPPTPTPTIPNLGCAYLQETFEDFEDGVADGFVQTAGFIPPSIVQASDGDRVYEIGQTGLVTNIVEFGPVTDEDFRVDFNFVVTQFGNSQSTFQLLYRHGAGAGNGVGFIRGGATTQFGSYVWSGFLFSELSFPILGIPEQFDIHMSLEWCGGMLVAQLRYQGTRNVLAEHLFSPVLMNAQGNFALYLEDMVIRIDDVRTAWEGQIATPTPTPRPTPLPFSDSNNLLAGYGPSDLRENASGPFGFYALPGFQAENLVITDGVSPTGIGLKSIPGSTIWGFGVESVAFPASGTVALTLQHQGTAGTDQVWPYLRVEP